MKTWRTTIHLPGPSASARDVDVIQHVRDRFHLGDRVIELGHAGIGRVRVRIDQAGQDHLALEVDEPRARPSRFQDLLIGADPITRSPLTARACRIEKS